MRWTGFIVGGILGAAAAVYFNRQNKPMLTNLSQMSGNVNQMMKTARAKMLDMALTKKFGSDSIASSSSGSKNAASIGDVEQIINKDPQLKQQVDAILQDNKVSAMPTQ